MARLRRAGSLALWLGCLLWGLCWPGAGSTLADTGAGKVPQGTAVGVRSSGYIIGTGDLLELSVWKDPALSRQMIVLPDGKVSLPLAGLVSAAGKTVEQFEQEVKQKIKPFISKPVLDISVVQMNSMMIYIVGKVHSPGRFPLTTDITVLQAIAMAGGPNRFADTDSIQVHRDVGGKTVQLNFDYDDVLEGVQLEQNIRLKRGDVVVVP